MSCILPPEIFDLIIDHLRDEPAALKTCCVVSKSWVPRTRSHIFACVEFDASRSPVELWEKTFPDPSNSPAHHTRKLFVHGIPVVNVVGAGVGGWIQTFHNVTHLEFTGLDRASLVPFHGLSPAVKSLRLDYSTTQVFDLICSFPLLEDLALVDPYHEADEDGWNTPLTSPKLTGSLDLLTFGTTRFITCQLLDLPGGLHFSRIYVTFSDGGEAKLMTDLVSGCSDTLETLIVTYYPQSAFHSAPVTDQHLTTPHRRRRVDDGFPRSLQDHNTQTRGFSANGCEVDRRVDHHDAPNRRTQKP